MTNTSAWQSIARPPWRYLFSSDPWRALIYTAITVVLGWILFFAYVMIILLPLAPAWSYVVAKIERQRIALLRLPTIGDPHPVIDAPLTTRAGARLGEAATWREVAYSFVLACVGPLISFGLMVLGGLVTVLVAAPAIVGSGEVMNMFAWQVDTVAQAWLLVPIAIPVIVVFAYVCSLCAAVTASIAQGLLGPREEELAERVSTLQASRGVLVDSFESERRRIERDLHDGPQQDLVGASMRLGELAYATTDATSRTELEAVQTRVERALSGLRETVRGVHPQVLDDHGVEAAIAELGGPPLDRVRTEGAWVPGTRLPAEVERVMYFTASEGVTNALKHAAAATVTVTLSATAGGGTFAMTVVDDGPGGADVGAGTGLAGLIERSDAVGARLAVSSPPGGPTVLGWSWVPSPAMS